MEESVIISCSNCSSKLRVPGNRGTIMVTCPVCRHQFMYAGVVPQANGVPRANVQPMRQTQTPPQRQAQTPPPRPSGPPCRTLTISRGKHAYKELNLTGLRNRLRDASPVQILLDGVAQGKLTDNDMELRLDSAEHRLAFTSLGSGYRIPAGTDDYMAMFFNNSFRIAPVVDPFRDQVTQFVLKMVRGQGFRDRILDPNNYNHAVKVQLQSTYIEVFTALNRTKGLTQWADGGRREKIYYQEIHLAPPPNDRLPSGYWDYLNAFIQEVIENDEEADLTHVAGGFTIRNRHSLY